MARCYGAYNHCAGQLMGRETDLPWQDVFVACRHVLQDVKEHLPNERNDLSKPPKLLFYFTIRSVTRSYYCIEYKVLISTTRNEPAVGFSQDNDD